MSFIGTAIGRLAAEPVLKTTAGGTELVEFRLCCDKQAGRSGGNFYNVSVWGNSQAHMQHLHQGMLVALPGAEMEHHRWTDSRTGARRERYVISARNVTYLSNAPRSYQPSLTSPVVAA